jgi:hypothetical protein
MVHAKPIRPELSAFAIMLVVAAVSAIGLAAFLGYLLNGGNDILAAGGGAALLVALIARRA